MGPEGPLRRVLEATRDSVFAQQRLILAAEAADAEQHKLSLIKKVRNYHCASTGAASGTSPAVDQ